MILLVGALVLTLPVAIVVFIIYKLAGRESDDFLTGVTKKD